MPETIESFVKKLQTEGIDAGNKAAEKIKKEARKEAEKIRAEATSEAEKILSEAQTKAEKELARGRTELELAVRDTLLKLRESLSKGLSAMLARNIEKKLSEPDYLGGVLREVVTAYARVDAGQAPAMEINLPEDMHARLNENVLKDLFGELGDRQEKTTLKATLSKAGFEYKIRGATVEVTGDSLAEVISDMVSPALQEILDKFISKTKKS